MDQPAQVKLSSHIDDLSEVVTPAEGYEERLAF